ncbi:probable sucrose-phosphate synthase 3 [Selaginella moellendorffii]|uniref:probable sucrose-phosphate synthase 3 n=1 Tax=Selaginella moellendorffii TaxID=88036 RepID=UPI000D1C75DE|nr:probable sucrose-phosphate synthase 3 [Selaginella moellendorffii]|eukprot:XP_024533254.1 probable sucrose-phosphate synthase 3 [Selaginella moellendorffii]
MAGNEWINGYLEAILDSGVGIDEQRASDRKAPASPDLLGFNASKYFVEEVVSGFDETDIHRTWVKATATRNVRERSARLENLCWRIWHLTRKKKQNEAEHAQRVSHRKIQREQGLLETTEDLSEGEKADPPVEVVPNENENENESSMKRIASDLEETCNAPSIAPASDEQQHKERKLYIVMISLHGLVRGENMELGRDSDTGGQVKYVVEFARALALMPEVYRVDLLTRQISAPDVDWSYGEPTEMLSSDENVAGESSGAYIVRIPCGPRDKYLRKELLWPYIQEFVDGALSHILNMSKVLGDQLSSENRVWPYVIHGHYADAGDSASLLSGALNVPMVLTGHSLGRNKLEQLLKQGRQSKEDINSTYRIMRRIEGEELALDAAELVITSTRQEIVEQWGLYDGFDVKLDKTLRVRLKSGVSCGGRYMPRMVVIPPGMDFSNVIVQDAGDVFEGEGDVAFTGTEAAAVTPVSPRPQPPIWGEVMRFFVNPHKPMVLALARPDPKKNITTLLKAFGECRPLRDLANLTLVMGNRDDIDEMSAASSNVLTQALKLIDKYDLYGQVAYPKHHKQSDVPEIYRLAAKTKGVFVNPALVEPFGLTLIEAAAHGLPMVATKNGGPVDIATTLENGVLVDPHDQKQIADGLLKLLADRNAWLEYRRNGLKNIHLYSWPQHCRTYLSRVALCRMRHPQWQSDDVYGNMDADSFADSLRDVQDMSLRLSDDGERSGSLNSSLEKILRGSNKNIEQLKQAFEKHMRAHEESDMSSQQQSNSNHSSNRLPFSRKKRRLFVIAVDSYDVEGSRDCPAKPMINVIQEILKAGKSDSGGRATSFVLSTALTSSETVSLLSSAGIGVAEFDALICSSGSELLYPGGGQNSDETNNNSSPGDQQLVSDPDYSIHIGYRWGGEGLSKAMQRLIANMGSSHKDGEGKEKEEDSQMTICGEESRGHSHCLAYSVGSGCDSDVPKVDYLRQALRMRGFRSHAIYCFGATKLHVLPLFASRSQALRYLFVRWGIDVSNMVLFVGEDGDTDYEQLLGGTHRVVILKGAVTAGSERFVRSSSSYTREDVAPNPSDGPYVAITQDDYSSEQIIDALKKF